MADEKKIVIELRSVNQNNGTANQTAEGSTNTTQEPLQPEQSDKVALAVFAAKELTMAVVNEGLAWANYEIDKNFSLTDNYIAQRNKQIALQCIGKVGSTAGTVLGMASAGTMIMPGIGTAVGAVIGTVMAASSTIRDNIQAMEQQKIMMEQMNAQLSYTRQKIGWSTNAASIGEEL